MSADRIIVIGGGIAGLAAALRLAPLPVTLICGRPLGEGTATGLAQGGIAAAIGADDAPARHAADTIAAGAGLVDPEVAAAVAAAAPAAIAWLEALGVGFDRGAGGAIALGLEAAHQRHRIVHIEGDGTGRNILAALIRAVKATASIEVMDGVVAESLGVAADGAVVGVHVRGPDEMAAQFLSGRAVVLATGGVGGLYAHTTNPLSSTGSGLLLAGRAGAVLRDLEFVQFHPTAIDIGVDPMPLASEALRGEGAILVDGTGARVVGHLPGAELASRDAVAAAIFARVAAGARVYLDASVALGARFSVRFPAVAALCRAAGIDPATTPIPVRPAAHYHMGGVKTDGRGRTSIAGLWAVGEVASTGLHGGNRLASNSLLEGLVYAGAVADDLKGSVALRRQKAVPADSNRPHAAASVRAVMDRDVGVLRDRAGLASAIARLYQHIDDDRALAGLLIATAAHERRESRGAHRRSDYPDTAAPESSEFTLAQLLARAADIAGEENVIPAIRRAG